MNYLYSVYLRLPNKYDANADLYIHYTPILKEAGLFTYVKHYYVYAPECSTNHLERGYLNRWLNISDNSKVFYTKDKELALTEFNQAYKEMEKVRDDLKYRLDSIQTILTNNPEKIIEE